LTTTRLNTTAKGDIAEQAVALALMAAGKTVLRPISNGLRYDLVVDNLDGTFTRVQCKTGMLNRGRTVLSFRVSNAAARRPSGVPYLGQVDPFGVFCAQDGPVYLFPSRKLGACAWCQEKGVRYAATYLLAQQKRPLRHAAPSN